MCFEFRSSIYRPHNFLYMYFVRWNVAANGFTILLTHLHAVSQERARALLTKSFKNWECITGCSSANKLFDAPICQNIADQNSVQYPLDRRTCVQQLIRIFASRRGWTERLKISLENYRLKMEWRKWCKRRRHGAILAGTRQRCLTSRHVAAIAFRGALDLT
jgi:hypothetical protein